MVKEKYGFEKKFTRLLNGPFPFFVVRFYTSTYDTYQRREAIWDELKKTAKDGLIDIHYYFYLLKISRLIEKKLIPEDAMFIDKYFDHSHCLIFCKDCTESISEVFKVLEKEALGNYHWKLVTYVRSYREIKLVFPKCISLLELPCLLPGHPLHIPSTSAGQLHEEKEDSDLGVRSLLKADEQTEGEESEKDGTHDIFLHSVPTNQKDFELDWEPVEEALQKLYVCSPDETYDMFGSTYIEDLKRHVAEMTQRHSDSQTRIYKQLEESLISHLIEIYTSTDGYEGYAFLQEVYKNLVLFRSLLAHLMLLFQSVGPRLTTPVELGLSLWFKYIVAPGKLITAMAISIRTEMDIQNDLVITELNEFLRLYPSAFQRFEVEYVRASWKFYESRSGQARSICTSSECSMEFLPTAKTIHHWKEYFQFSDEELGEELKLAEAYLLATGQQLLLDAFHMHYFTKYNDWLKLCLKQSIDDDDYALVGRMHSLLSRLPSGFIQLKDLLVSHVEESFKLGSNGSHDAVVNGEHLLLLRHKYDQLISESLSNDKSLAQAVNTTFRKIANSDKECAKSMAAYIDSRLRQTITRNIEQEIQEAFTFVVKHVNHGAFKLFYWHYMAYRLINMESSFVAERNLVEMMRIHYGSDFTNNLEQMLHEMDSQQQNLEGCNSIFPNECPSTSFMILDSRYWPMKHPEPFNLPLDVCPMIEKFEAQFLCRKFWWQTHLGSATLTVTFSNGQRHDLQVSTPQMSVLMLFNAADSLTYREIQEATRMTDANLRPCLQSLLSADGTSILTVKRHSEDEFSENDILSFNEKFNGQLDLFWKHEFEPEKLVEIVDEAQKHQDEAQKHHIEAAILRIMKSEKSLDHSGLVIAVTNALEPLFITTPAAIKRRIEKLIDNEVLQRERDDPSRYRYV